ncbi:peptidase-like protein [Xylariales sp. PMI_506]|nr:peptidase-like protein [Xylariales sp. PMI_506]
MRLPLIGNLVFASTSLSKSLTPDRIEADISTDGLRSIISSLNEIAESHDGNRGFGLPGFRASVDFVLSQVPSSMDVYLQPFNASFAQTREISVTGPDGESVKAVPMMFNPPTPIPDGFTAPLLDTPVDDRRGSMCAPADWQDIDASNHLVLVKRGVCSIADKLRLARSHGALGVILYHNEPGVTIPSATLLGATAEEIVPAAIIPLEVGVYWKERLAADEKLIVRLLVDSVSETRESWNVIAETRQGDPDNVVVLGAHLDSVQEGPGSNDDGSGSAALIEIMRSVARYDGFGNKLRFAWWGAEESGLVGSLHYCETLDDNEADRIRFYFNYDMIGSIDPSYGVYQGHPSGAQPLFDYLAAQGKNPHFGAFADSSDYVGFVRLNIPSSGLDTGGDPCYHAACDTADNVDYEALTINARAAARVAAQMALSLKDVPRRGHTASGSTLVAQNGELDFGLKPPSWASLSLNAARRKHGVV